MAGYIKALNQARSALAVFKAERERKGYVSPESVPMSYVITSDREQAALWQIALHGHWKLRDGLKKAFFGSLQDFLASYQSYG